jgi:hypothetical protein
MRDSKTAAIQNECTCEAVFDGITTIDAETFTKANAMKINYKPESGRIRMPVGVGFAGIELPAINNIKFGAMTPDEVGKMSDQGHGGGSDFKASIEDFKRREVMY